MKMTTSSSFVFLGALLLSSLPTYAGPISIPMESNDLHHLRQGELFITPVITKDKKPTGTFGNVATTLPLVFANSYYAHAIPKSEGYRSVQYDINDPTQFIMPLLVRDLQRIDGSLQWHPTQVINQLQPGIDQFNSEIGDRTALGLMSNGWHLRHSSSLGLYVLTFSVTAKLVSGPTQRTLWQATCDYQGDAHNATPYTYRDYEMNNGALIKFAIAQGAEYCANQLALNFEDKI